MAKIRLTRTFEVIPEGTYVFKITNVEYKEDFGKMKVTFETKDGKKLIENYNLLDSNGEPNAPALNAFSAMAEAALDVPADTEIDESDLLGCYLKCNVVHNEGKNGGKFAHLGYDKEHADGFDDDDDSEAAPALKPAKGSIDLNSILNS